MRTMPRSAAVHLIDLCYLGVPQTIASYLVVGPTGPALIETGPGSTFPRLISGLKEHGFEDIIHVDDKGIQTVLKEVDNEELALALKTASDRLKEKIFSNMSTRAADLIREDMQYMGPVRLSDVEAAQQRIVDIVRRLEDAGEIIISGRGGDKDLVV
jgi:flagellar motor switch protein FliG